MEEAVHQPQSKDQPPNGDSLKDSFKIKLQGISLYHKSNNTEVNINPLFDSQIEEEVESDDDSPPNDVEEDLKCPIILLTKEEKRRLRMPWKSSLIIKMFDKNIGYMTLMRRLSKKWQLKGELTLTDLGCSYYIARFSKKEDYQHVLTDGPWLIDDHYLTIRTWVPNFIPDNEPIRFLTTWVRIPNLAMEYFDSGFLRRIREKIGKVIKFDATTAAATRGNLLDSVWN
ncbi:Fructokinase-2 [Bienertia sinuspersici]